MANTINQTLARQIANASTTGGGNWIRHGLYLFVVERLLLKQGYKGVSFIAELRVKVAQATVDGVVPNPVGSSCSNVQSLSNPATPNAMGAVKAFILTLLGITESTEDEFVRAFEELVGPTQLARGLVVACETYDHTTQKGKEIVLPKWSHVVQAPEEITAERAALDRGAAAA